MEWYHYLLIVAGILVGLAIGVAMGMALRKKFAEKEIGSAEQEAARIVNEAIHDAESKKREAYADLLKIRERAIELGIIERA